MVSHFTLILVILLLQKIEAEDFDPNLPYIVVHPKSQNISKGETLTLDCFSFGNKINYAWFKDGLLVTKWLEVESNKRSHFKRVNVNRADEGKYMCAAKNEVGEKKSKIAEVKFNYLEKDFTKNPENGERPRLASHEFKCVAPNGFPTPETVWLHNNKEIAKDKFTNKEFTSILTLNDLSWRDHGEYQCRTSNIAGQSFSTVAFLKVIVPAPKIVSQMPVGDEIEVYETQKAQLNCEVQFYNLYPDRVWKKLDGAMPSDDRTLEPKDGVLIISNTQLSDSGSYKCFVSNDAGKDELIVQLKVYSPLEIIIPPPFISVAQGFDIKLPCQVAGGKSPVVTWHHRGQTYKYDASITSQLRIYVDDKSQLILTDARKEDQGKVYCTVEDKDLDKVISSSPDVSIIVLENKDIPPPTVKLLPEKITNVREGGSFSLQCDTQGKGKLRTVWHFGAEKIANSGRFSIVTLSNGEELTVTNTIIKDSGIYKCTVEGDGGSNQATSSVTVIESDDKLPSEVKNVQVKEDHGTWVVLSWDKSQPSSLAPITVYAVTIKEIKTNTMREKVHSDLSKLEATIDKLTANTQYEFSVSAKNKNGPGVAGAVIAVTKNVLPSVAPTVDKLENVFLNVGVGTVTSQSVQLHWKDVSGDRVLTYFVYYKRKKSKRLRQAEFKVGEQKVLRSLHADTDYELFVNAANNHYESPQSNVVTFKTLSTAFTSFSITMKRFDKNSIVLSWPPPEDFVGEVKHYVVTCKNPVDSSPCMLNQTVSSTLRKSLLTVPDPDVPYDILVIAELKSGPDIFSKKQTVVLSSYAIGDYISGDDGPGGGYKTGTKSELLRLVSEPWFIAAVSVLVVLVIVIVVACRCWPMRKQRNKKKYGGYHESSRGLLSRQQSDYHNASLSRGRGPLRDPNFSWSESRNSEVFISNGKPKSKLCCKKSDTSSIEDSFSNLVVPKASTQPRTRHESIELRGGKASNQDPTSVKENNIGVAWRNGCMVDTPLNNERHLLRKNNPDNLEADQKSPYSTPIDDPHVASPNPSQRGGREPNYKSNSVERRHAEIVRTANKSFPDAQLANVLENNPQATWKREKLNDVSTQPIGSKTPGENTLRRMGKSPFKPLPKLEVLNWADGLPDPAKTEGSQHSSPKQSSTASMFGDQADADLRPESRTSHGGSNGSLNKYPFEKRRRRISNASSMMSSELYQSEMDPSGYSDAGAGEPEGGKKSKKKVVPPPIELEGLTSDILLQWAESVTNSSASSSGSSSPSRCSGISSEGSIYTDADFANAVAEVRKYNGFNYDYSLPGMPTLQTPLSSARNSKMDKIDQVLASKQKSSKQQQHDPKISMTNYLTGTSKGPNSTSSIPVSTRGGAQKNPKRYGTGLEDVDSISSSATPLTVSNLLHHDSSLERGKKPLTMSNLSRHETSLERASRHQVNQPVAAKSMDRKVFKPRPKLAPPEPPLSMTSALERNESINSKESVNSSQRHDSEVENKPSTAERAKRPKKSQEYQSSSNQSTPSTIRSTENEMHSEC